jgi:hypothetical protein
MKKIFISVFVMLLVIIIAGFGFLFTRTTSEYLRGSVVKSQDGKTYLMVTDDNGGGCGPIFVDQIKWPYKINEKGLIEPGLHTIKCGGELQFIIPTGSVFSFDYWGP